MSDRIDKVWIYKAMNNGKVEEGIVQAATKEEAETRVRRLGVENAVIEDPSAVKIPSIATPAAPPPMPSLPSGIRNMGLSTPAKTVREQIQVAATQAAGIAADMVKRKARKQSIVYGDDATVVSQASGLLEKNGCVVHALMRPDNHGKMKLLLVIEHDEEKKQ
jgi:hypothetical protein